MAHVRNTPIFFYGLRDLKFASEWTERARTPQKNTSFSLIQMVSKQKVLQAFSKKSKTGGTSLSCARITLRQGMLLQEFGEFFSALICTAQAQYVKDLEFDSTWRCKFVVLQLLSCHF